MKRFQRILTLAVAAAMTLTLAACQGGSSSQAPTGEAATSAAAEEASASEMAVKTDLSKLHAVDYDGDEFAGAWRITEGTGEQFKNFSFVFDGSVNAYLVVGSMAYCGKYELNTEEKIFGTQQAFGLNGTYHYEFSEDKNTVSLTNTETNDLTVMQKQVSFTFIPKAEAEFEIDEALLGAWKDDSGGYLYFEDNGIMYDAQKALSFTFYTYSAGDGKVEATYYTTKAEEIASTYKVEGDRLTYNDYPYTRISADELE